jgi:hypothetical protein
MSKALALRQKLFDESAGSALTLAVFGCLPSPDSSGLVMNPSGKLSEDGYMTRSMNAKFKLHQHYHFKLLVNPQSGRMKIARQFTVGGKALKWV